jgi:hypothetical protein
MFPRSHRYVGVTTGFSTKKRKGPYKNPQIIPKVYGLAKYGLLDL